MTFAALCKRYLDLDRQREEIRRRWLLSSRYPAERAAMRAEQYRIEREMQKVTEAAR